MYFYYKMYTICTLFYNTIISFQELCMSLLTPFTYSSPSTNSGYTKIMVHLSFYPNHP